MSASCFSPRLSRVLAVPLILPLILIGLFAGASTALADDSGEEAYETYRLPYQVIEREEVPAREKAMNLGIVYGAQWGFYLASQHSIIKEYGSIHNWTHYPFRAHFDKDTLDYNIFKHSIAGQYYYLFYRSRGYTEKNAFLWAVASSLLFEFTIETVTEQPSYQDMYQTPVFGTLVGMAFERLSSYLHSLHTTPTTLLAYALNPFTLYPSAYYKMSAAPMLGEGRYGVALALEY